jgi:hypothetical protein
MVLDRVPAESPSQSSMCLLDGRETLKGHREGASDE